jgi:transcriptional regulator with XRE-family HTH domain
MSILRKTRLENEVTLQEIADRTGLARITIRNAEKGLKVAEMSAIKIVHALNAISGKSYTIEELGIKTREYSYKYDKELNVDKDEKNEVTES